MDMELRNQRKRLNNARWYKANKERHKSSTIKSRAKRIQANREHVRTLKESTPCADCKKHYPYYVMDFDHIEKKVFNIARALGEGVALRKIKQEISKCEVVCANCHRIRTQSRNKKPVN